jgi:hypothetical protein
MMKCPICKDETFDSAMQRWGPEFAHTRCVRAYNVGKEDADARLEAIEAAARNLVKVKGRYHTEQAFKSLVAALETT